MQLFGSIAGAESVLMSFDADLKPDVVMAEAPHGTAPRLFGKNVANPMGAILSAALMLDYLGLAPEALAVEAAVQQAVVSGQGTREIGGSLGTRETGDVIARAIRT